MITNVYTVPLIAQPQTFGITLGSTLYNLTLKWNTVGQMWVLDIADTSNTPIVTGIPLITGADLLEQYAYLNFGGALYAQTDNDTFEVPTYDNLGSDSHLYYVTLTAL